MTDIRMTGRATVTSASTRTEERLEQRWVPVTDETGRTHMEAVWITVGGRAAASAA